LGVGGVLGCHQTALLNAGGTSSRGRARSLAPPYNKAEHSCVTTTLGERAYAPCGIYLDKAHTWPRLGDTRAAVNSPDYVMTYCRYQRGRMGTWRIAPDRATHTPCCWHGGCSSPPHASSIPPTIRATSFLNRVAVARDSIHRHQHHSLCDARARNIPFTSGCTRGGRQPARCSAGAPHTSARLKFSVLFTALRFAASTTLASDGPSALPYGFC